jgi:hypothetical protein
MSAIEPPVAVIGEIARQIEHNDRAVDGLVSDGLAGVEPPGEFALVGR